MDNNNRNSIVTVTVPPKPTWQNQFSPVGNHFPIVGIGKRSKPDPTPDKPEQIREYSYLDQEFIQKMLECGINMAQCQNWYNTVVYPEEPEGIELPKDMADKSVKDSNESTSSILKNLRNCYYTAVSCEREGMQVIMRFGNPQMYYTNVYDEHGELEHECSFDKDGSLTEKGTDEFIMWEKRWEVMTRRFADFKSIAGWMFWDEPRAAVFPEIKEYLMEPNSENDPWNRVQLITALPKTGKKFDFMGPERPGKYDTKQERASSVWDTYTQYSKDFGSILKPKVFLYDFYPFECKDGNGGKVTFDRNFFALLDIYRYRTKERNNTFWITICTMETYIIGSKLLKPAPTFTQLMYQINCALAYGAQGFCYWTMFIRNSNDYEEYRNAPMVPGTDDDIKTTEIFENIKLANAEIRKWEPVFLNCDSRYCAPTKKLGDEAGPYLRPFDFSHPFSFIKTMTSPKEKGFLVSMVRNQGFDYIVVINLHHSEKQSTKITFRSPVFDMEEILPIEAHDSAITAEVNVYQENISHSFNFNPGEMKVFRVID